MAAPPPAPDACNVPASGPVLPRTLPLYRHTQLCVHTAPNPCAPHHLPRSPAHRCPSPARLWPPANTLPPTLPLCSHLHRLPRQHLPVAPTCPRAWPTCSHVPHPNACYFVDRGAAARKPNYERYVDPPSWGPQASPPAILFRASSIGSGGVGALLAPQSGEAQGLGGHQARLCTWRRPVAQGPLTGPQQPPRAGGRLGEGSLAGKLLCECWQVRPAPVNARPVEATWLWRHSGGVLSMARKQPTGDERQQACRCRCWAVVFPELLETPWGQVGPRAWEGPTEPHQESVDRWMSEPCLGAQESAVGAARSRRHLLHLSQPRWDPHQEDLGQSSPLGKPPSPAASTLSGPSPWGMPGESERQEVAETACAGFSPGTCCFHTVVPVARCSRTHRAFRYGRRPLGQGGFPRAGCPHAAPSPASSGLRRPPDVAPVNRCWTQCLSLVSTDVKNTNTWLLFLPLFPVQVQTLIVVIIGMVVLLLDLLGLVQLGQLLIFHIYLKAKKLTTFEYLIKTRKEESSKHQVARKDPCAQIEDGFLQQGDGALGSSAQGDKAKNSLLTFKCLYHHSTPLPSDKSSSEQEADDEPSPSSLGAKVKSFLLIYKSPCHFCTSVNPDGDSSAKVS
ncbi:PREDICTED: uncharacterized protein LOC105600712 [Cercocebus atys]|uniref:uncharacterized protein LOC105600712 n=1 Tax=Cercocebus atys TaxID=9531 RepID=UPI0005F4F47E|nr:PREDICTED: uncharacterized protein LOC105600712 [Cercocebus atys]